MTMTNEGPDGLMRIDSFKQREHERSRDVSRASIIRPVLRPSAASLAVLAATSTSSVTSNTSGEPRRFVRSRLTVGPKSKITRDNVRQRQILLCVCAHLSNSVIASLLDMSEGAVKMQVGKLRARYHAATREELAIAVNAAIREETEEQKEKEVETMKGLGLDAKPWGETWINQAREGQERRAVQVKTFDVNGRGVGKVVPILHGVHVAKMTTTRGTTPTSVVIAAPGGALWDRVWTIPSGGRIEIGYDANYTNDPGSILVSGVSGGFGGSK